MPKYYSELTDIMRAQGCWRVEGGKGSHEKWRSPINDRTITVPRFKSRHTANEVLKQLGIARGFSQATKSSRREAAENSIGMV